MAPAPRSRVRSKVEENGTSGFPRRYSTRSLDICTRQLGQWSPFASCSAAVGGGEVMSEYGTFAASSLPLQPCYGFARTTDARDPHDPILPNSLLQQDSGACNNTIVASFPLNPTSVEPTDCGMQVENSNLGDGLSFPQVPSFEARAPKPDIYELVSSNGRSGVLLSRGRSGGVQGWSKRRKQLSHALMRGLWRWKEGVHTRKRMKRSGSYNSGSGKSSDRALQVSEPSTVPTSKGGQIRWSDIHLTPTDSSGELFYCGNGVGTPSNLLPELTSLAKEWAASECVRCWCTDDAAPECDHCWLRSDNYCVESGYGSEPGYRGDAELEVGDGDELDEEEREPDHLRVWREMMADHCGPQCDERETDHVIIQDCMMELLSGRSTHVRKLQQRLRRRRSAVYSIRRL